MGSEKWEKDSVGAVLMYTSRAAVHTRKTRASISRLAGRSRVFVRW